MSGEIWRPVSSSYYADRYSVSNRGSVRSELTGKLLKQKRTRDGYLEVTLCVAGRRKTIRVHRLVAQVFIPNPCDKPTVNHKDLNKTNNLVGNLEWNTVSENTKHAADNGRLDYVRRPDMIEQSRKNVAIATAVRAEQNKKPVVNLTTGEMFDSALSVAVSLGDREKRSSITKACKGKLKKAYGCSWAYATKEGDCRHDRRHNN